MVNEHQRDELLDERRVPDADVMMESPRLFVVFEVFYWTGIREGELLAHMPDSFYWRRNTMRIDKSYQRLRGRDIITDLKTPKSIRTVKLPNFLAETIRDYLSKHPKIGPGDRMFPVSKSQLSRVMKRGSKKAGVKRIRIHDLRHSHVSLLIDMGFSVVPDIRTYKILRDEMRAVYKELCRLHNYSEMNERLSAKVDLLAELFAGIAGEAPESPLELEDSLIGAMERR